MIRNSRVLPSNANTRTADQSDRRTPQDKSGYRGGSGRRDAAFNGGMEREVERGAYGMPQDKMLLIREKKDDIERAYRQDCETFAAVVKMLLSKDASLEEKLQHSLRENLKEIAQRCIHELREFIERLKTEEDIVH